MKSKIICIAAILILFVGMFTVIVTVANAKCFNILCLKQGNIIVTLKDDANIKTSEDTISKIPQLKIIDIKDRNKEWSDMVNRMDLPNMENPFKNEFIIKTNKKANVKEIYNTIKEMDFVEKVELVSNK